MKLTTILSTLFLVAAGVEAATVPVQGVDAATIPGQDARGCRDACRGVQDVCLRREHRDDRCRDRDRDRDHRGDRDRGRDRGRECGRDREADRRECDQEFGELLCP
jgi:hypothetical protein